MVAESVGDIAQQRFWAKVDRASDCWMWIGGKTWDGYGRVRLAGRNFVSHRVSYEWSKGPIPGGLELDHLCRNVACVNPAHLEAVTRDENQHRRAALIMHCPAGHRYDEQNTRYTGRQRYCRACNRDAQRRIRERKKLAL